MDKSIIVAAVVFWIATLGITVGRCVRWLRLARDQARP